jgi:hypothetical protein
MEELMAAIIFEKEGGNDSLVYCIVEIAAGIVKGRKTMKYIATV